MSDACRQGRDLIPFTGDRRLFCCWWRQSMFAFVNCLTATLKFRNRQHHLDRRSGTTTSIPVFHCGHHYMPIHYTSAYSAGLPVSSVHGGETICRLLLWYNNSIHTVWRQTLVMMSTKYSRQCYCFACRVLKRHLYSCMLVQVIQRGR